MINLLTIFSRKDNSDQPTRVTNGITHNPIIKWMDYTIDFIEAAIIRVSILLLIAGSIMSTVSFLTPQFQLSSIPWYNLAWAITQAIALDGLFAGLLFRLRGWKELDRSAKCWYGFNALFLGIIAILVNATLSYQEIHPVVDIHKHTMTFLTVVDTMTRLGINQTTFAYARSILVVLVIALVCTLPKDTGDNHPVVEENKDEEQSRILEEKLAVIINQVVTSKVDRLESLFLQGVYQVNQIEPPMVEEVTLSTYDRILQFIQDNPSVTNDDIVSTLDIPKGTVKVYAAKARKSLQLERVTDGIQAV
jgi:hypothetical protein